MNDFSKTAFTPSLIVNCLVQDFKEERLIKILIDEKMSIRQFKLKLQDEYQIPYACQCLVFHNKYKYTNESILYEMLENRDDVDDLSYEICIYLHPNDESNIKSRSCRVCTYLNEYLDETCVMCLSKLRIKPESEIKDLNVFDCTICLEKSISSVNEFVLKNCKHKFCQKCLMDYINHLDNVVDIKCPTNCLGTIDESDVKRILDKDSLEKYLFKKERLKILAIKNRFHCLTPNCVGYFVKNDAIKSQETLFKCQSCNEINCLKCQRLVNKSDTASHECNLSIEHKIADPLENLIENGIIMKCPRCEIYLEKRDTGCDFIRCYYCKLDICFITRQPRWGPGGKGDISGGCKCGLNGKKCHPDCQNCH